MNSRHPGLNSILTKLHQCEHLTYDELQRLQRHLDELRENAREGSRRFEPSPKPVQGERFSGHATAEGGERFAARSSKDCAAFYRTAQDTVISSIGIGTYRGGINNDTDVDYAMSECAAFQAGINLIDTALTYRRQRSECMVATAIQSFIDTCGGSRDEIVVCTKGGYLVPEAITAGTLKADDVVGGAHSIAPAFLTDQIDRSRQNLGLETIDIYYLHNPETPLEFVDSLEFITRIRGAFEMLERAVTDMD
ncbi:MAG: aldo/keto reductase [Methylobacter sp.]|nr:aldo/keto reductase [Methylobacter sp.]